MPRFLTATLTAAPIVALALGASVSSCSQRSPGEATASTQSAIEKGQPINVASDPVSSEFPLSTVYLETTETDPDDGNTYVDSCTGTIISPTQILTAAHCTLNQTTSVGLYPTTPGSGMVPIHTIPLAGATFTYPPGVVCIPPFPGNCLPVFLSCLTGAPCTASTGTFADLAIINLPWAITGPKALYDGYRPAVLGPPGTFDDMYDRTSTWAVGTGYMNIFSQAGGNWVVNEAGVPHLFWDSSIPAVQNDDHGMEWVPTVLWLPSGTNDDKGSFATLVDYADRGDSGGPLFQYAAPADAGPSDGGVNDLILIGVLHGVTRDLLHSEYTSVENAVNNAWILGEIQTAAVTNVATFGASRAP